MLAYLFQLILGFAHSFERVFELISEKVEKDNVSCQGVGQLWGLVFQYYWVFPPRWGLVKSVLFTIIAMLYKIKNTCLILLSHFILHHFASMLHEHWTYWFIIQVMT